MMDELLPSLTPASVPKASLAGGSISQQHYVFCVIPVHTTAIYPLSFDF